MKPESLTSGIMSASVMKLNPHLPPSVSKPPSKVAAREKDIHGEIIDECKARGWYYVHSRTDAPTTTALGVTDFIIARSGGVVWWVEVKRPGQKLTLEQAAVRVMLLHLNQNYALVHSLEEFRAAMK